MKYILIASSLEYIPSSNVSIAENILRSYQKKSEKCEVLRINDNWDLSISEFEMITFVLFDNICPVPDAIKKIREKFPGIETRAFFDVFIYGNSFHKFTRHDPEWKFFVGLKIHFFFLGNCQLKQSELFFDHEASSVYPYDLSLDLKEFKSESSHNRMRKWLYAGRISFQKNIHVLIKAFHFSLKQYPMSELKIIGSFDDIGGSQYESFASGTYKNFLTGFVDNLPAEVKSKISFVGEMPRELIWQEICNADLVANLSTFESEVLSLTMLEAAYFNRPTLRSNWGGVIEGLDKQSLVVNVVLKNENVVIDENDFFSKIKGETLVDFKSPPKRLTEIRYALFQGVKGDLSRFFDKSCLDFSSMILYNEFINPIQASDF
jgi:glycosyltransferase involved in cell wall biosynthesis